MKLNYRGVSYDYNPPHVEFTETAEVGKYRGLDIRFRRPVKVLVQQPTLDLMYRGVAYTTNPQAGVAPVAAPVVAPVAAPVAATAAVTAQSAPLSLEDRARNLLMNHHRFIKRRQQSMLGRLDVEVGLTAGDAAHYWNHIQGKVHPSFGATYDRSHATMS
ncbi:MAG TPA: DUF4278 domain-containing protein [Chroococcidiopsis sp.]